MTRGATIGLALLLLLFAIILLAAFIAGPLLTGPGGGLLA